jgi:hypothetical protein
MTRFITGPISAEDSDTPHSRGCNPPTARQTCREPAHIAPLGLNLTAHEIRT